MKKLVAVIYVCLVMLMAYKVLFPAPTEIVETPVLVKAGDNMWDLCNKHYMKNNAESFNEFYHLNTKAIGYNIQPGEEIIIRNKVYK